VVERRGRRYVARVGVRLGLDYNEIASAMRHPLLMLIKAHGSRVQQR
jgi:hypothetical protein